MSTLSQFIGGSSSGGIKRVVRDSVFIESATSFVDVNLGEPFDLNKTLIYHLGSSQYGDGFLVLTNSTTLRVYSGAAAPVTIAYQIVEYF